MNEPKKGEQFRAIGDRVDVQPNGWDGLEGTGSAHVVIWHHDEWDGNVAREMRIDVSLIDNEGGPCSLGGDRLETLALMAAKGAALHEDGQVNFSREARDIVVLTTREMNDTKAVLRAVIQGGARFEVVDEEDGARNIAIHMEGQEHPWIVSAKSLEWIDNVLPREGM